MRRSRRAARAVVVRRRGVCAGSWRRALHLVGGAGVGCAPGDPLPGAHAGRVHRVPARPRRLHRSGDGRRRTRARVQRHQLRRVPQRAGDRRRRRDARGARRLSRRGTARSQPLERRRRHAASTCSRCRRTAASRNCRPTSNVIARRAPIPLFGAGLVEAIADETMLALEDPLDRNGDGVSGRAAIVVDLATGERRVGRFGWKAQHATLLAFGADAYRNEMGITNDVFRDEVGFGVDAARDAALRSDSRSGGRHRSGDAAPRHRQLRSVHAAARADRASRRSTTPVATASASSPRSAARRCHVPCLTTAPTRQPALRSAAGAALLGPAAARRRHRRRHRAGRRRRPREIRTPALWGLGLRRPFLHDGSAATIEDAIERHGEEAGLARDGYLRLDPAERARLLAFLSSL